MRLFLFSLRYKALGWLQSLQPSSVATWEELAQKFLTKFFPLSKTSHLRGEVAQFRQMDFKPLYEAWERFKDLIWRCPQHGYQDWFQIQLFYNGLNGQTQTIIDVVASSTLLSKTMKKAQKLLEEMAANNFQCPNVRSLAKKVARVHEVNPIVSLSAQVPALTNQITTFTTLEAASSKESAMVANTSYIGEGVDQE